LTAGSSIGKQDSPIWCETKEAVDKSLFSWNAPSGGNYSTDPAKAIVYIYVGLKLSDSFMKNDDDSGIGYPLCKY